MARGLIAFGLGMPFGVVFGVVDTIAVDTGRTVSSWYGVAAAALAAGIVLAAVMGRAAVNLGTALGSALAICSLIAAGAWVALFNTGDQAAVDALIAIGLAASVPMLALAAIDGLTLQPDARPIAAVGQPAAAAFAGVALGAFVMFLDPTLVWSDVTAVGGAIAAVRCAAQGRTARPSARGCGGSRAVGRGRLPDRCAGAPHRDARCRGGRRGSGRAVPVRAVRRRCPLRAARRSSPPA